MEKTVPSIGRIVHYFSYGSPGGEFAPAEVRAAIVTEVCQPDNPESALGLAVLNPTGIYFNRSIPYGSGKPGHWGWPPYVPPVQVSDK